MAAARARCYVCGQRVPHDRTAVMRHRVRSGAVNTRRTFIYRMVRRCVPHCDTTPTE